MLKTMFPTINQESSMLGFGCMRFPCKPDGKIDEAEAIRLIRHAIDSGVTYIDTAYPYHGGESEIVVGKALQDGYREKVVLATKLPCWNVHCHEDMMKILDEQLEKLQTDHIDFYLMHAQDAELFEKYKKCRAYETALEFLAEGRIKHLGMSFHDKAAVLDQILTEYPQVEVVQLQINYADFDDPMVEGRKCLEVCRKHGKPVIVMEPVKGGSLVKLPAEAQEVFDRLGGGSNASYAIRYAASFPGIMMVLSGMSNMEQMNDNISFMKEFAPLSDEEHRAISEVCGIFRGKGLIACTACRYCTEVCPTGIAIPDLFACMNNKKLFNAGGGYYNIYTRDGNKASACVKCGRCETICPQKLPIRQLLEDVAAEFEK